jgi:hypothetical protein
MTSDAVETRPPVTAPDPGGGPGIDTSARVWFVVLVVGLVAAAPLLLWWGRKQWFFLDEWSFLVDRHLTDVPSLLRAHNGHWVTLPAILYRVVFAIFGLRYFPYQLLAVLSHLGVIVLTWFTMRRLGVRPAIATITALPFVLYGAGRSNILFGFQISLTGSIVFGLAQLLLATADRPSRRRDIIGIFFGLASIMCSAVGIPMVAGVALAVALRRGWRAAALHAVPLAVVYAVWYLAYATDEAGNDRTLGTQTVSFVWRMVRAAFEGMGQNPVVALALALVAAVGIVRAVQDARVDLHAERFATVVALVTASLGFAALTAVGRAQGFGVGYAASDRYIYVVAALWLPIVALGAEVLASRWLLLGAIPLVLLLIGLPDNLDLLRHPDPLTLGTRDGVVAVARSPLLEQLPPGTRLFSIPLQPDFAPTAEFLRDAASDGKLPDLDDLSDQALLTADRVIAVDQTGAPGSGPCPATRPRVEVRAERGTRITFSGTVMVSTRNERGGTSYPAILTSKAGDVIAVRAGPVDLLVTGPLGRPPAICRVESS